MVRASLRAGRQTDTVVALCSPSRCSGNSPCLNVLARYHERVLMAVTSAAA